MLLAVREGVLTLPERMVPAFIAHEAAHIQDAALIGVGCDGVARRSAVVDGAVIAACQSADIGGTQAQDALQGHGVVLFPGGEHHIPQTTLIQAEESGVVAAVGLWSGTAAMG